MFKYILTTIILFFSVSANATSSWESTGYGYSINNDKTKLIRAQLVNHNALLFVAFELMAVDGSSCYEETYKTNGEANFQKKIMSLNGQKLRMKTLCKNLAGSSDKYILMIPDSTNAMQFINNEFKHSNNVTIKLMGDNYIMSANGFTKAYNKEKGNIII